MKVKFTKLAALLLAGVALFATGCTDYEVDIQKVDKKVDNLTSEVNNKIASLEQQIAGINATIATLETKAAHDADIQTLRNEMASMKTTIENDYNSKINTAVDNLTTKINDAVSQLTGEIDDLETLMNTELAKKLDVAVYNADKEALAQTIAGINQAITDVSDALDAAKLRIQALEDADYQGQIDAANGRIDDANGRIDDANGRIDAANGRIQALEDAHFQDQIDAAKERITKLENLLAGDWKGKTVKQTIDALQEAIDDVAQSVADLESTVNGKINALDERLTKAEAAIKEIKETTIPALQAQVDDINNVKIPALQADIEALKSGKLDKATFEEYKEATANTIRLMQEAIQNLEDTKLDKSVFDEKMEKVDKQIADILAKFDDYVLKSTFEDFVKIAATKKELKDVRAELDGRIKVCENLLKGDWGGKTVQEYIDAKVADLQGQVDKIVKELIPALDKRVEDLEKCLKDVVLPQIQFAIDYKGVPAYAELGGGQGGLQGYINDMAIDTFIAACQYTDTEVARIDSEIAVIKSRLDVNEANIAKLLARVQSIVYVPDYDDMKMTINLVYYTDYDGHFLVLGKDTEAEYKVNPADAFGDLATLKRLVADRALVFDVKSVKVRSSEGDVENAPAFDIKDVTKYDPSTGKFTLLFTPNNVVSSAFADYQVDPSGMYFTLLKNEVIGKGNAIELLTDEDGNYFLGHIPMPTDFNPEQFSEDVQTGEHYEIDVEAGYVPAEPGYFQETYGNLWPIFWGVFYGQQGVNDAIGYAFGYRWQAEEGHMEPDYTPYIWYTFTAEDLADYVQALADLQTAIDDYNAGVLAGIYDENARIEKYNELMEAYNAAVDSYNAALAKYFEGLQRRGGSKNFAAALNIYVADQATNISSTYTTLYPSRYEESEHIQILKQPYILGEDGKVVKYGDRNQDLAFNSKEVKQILDGAIPAVKVTNAQGKKGRILSYPQALAEGYLVIEPTWKNAEISYSPKKEAKYFVVENEFEDKVPPYATVEMNYEDTNHPEGGFNNATLKGRVGDVVTGKYTLIDNMFGNKWSWKGTITVVPPTAGIDLSLEKPITWTYANDAVIDHNRFYKVADASTEYFRNDQVVKIDTDLSVIEKEFGITPANLQGILPTDKDREVVMYSVVAKDAKGKEVAYNVHYEDGVYVAYTVDADGVETLAEDIDPLKIGHVDLDSKTAKLDMNITNFEWDMTYTVKANYYYSEPNSEKVSVIVAVNFEFNTVDRSRAKVVLPLNEYTFNINQFDKTTGFGFVEKDPFADSYYAWKGAPQHAAIKAGFEAAGVTKASDFKDQAAFNAAELTGKIEMAKPSGSAAGYIDIDKAGIFGQTMSSFKGSILQKFAQKDEKGNFVQDPENPYKFLGAVQTRNITTYIGQEVEIPFKFNWIVPAYDYEPLENQTMKDDANVWYSWAAPKYIDNRDVLTKYDVSYMNVPALAFNIVDKQHNYFSWKDKVNAAPYFYDKNLVSSFFYTDPKFGDTELDENSQTETLKKYADLWSSDDKVNFEHSVFYYRSTLDAIPMFGKLEIQSGDARFEIPTSFGDPYTGVKLVETPYSNYELRAWKPFVVKTYKQTLNLDLSNPGMYEVDLLKGIQFYDARQVKESSTGANIQVANGVKCWLRPMLKTTGGWVVGNGQAANGYANGVTSAQAYEIKVADFDWDSTSAVPAQYRGLINIVEDPDTYTYKMQFDYNSEIAFQKTAEVKFTFELQTRWQVLEPFEVTVVIRGLDAQ